MATVPEPFGHLDVPPRTPQQKEKDRKRNREQTRLLAGRTTTSTDGSDSVNASAAGQNGIDELVSTLIKRRSKAGSDVVRLATAPTDSKQWSLVVPGELLVRLPDVNSDLSSQALKILKKSKFSVVEPADDSGGCPELDRRLSLFKHSGTAKAWKSDMRTAMTQLQGQLVQASPHLVAALHAGPTPPPPPIVAKAAVGPAPTRVDYNHGAFHKVGEHVPGGRVVVAVIDTGIVEATRHDKFLNDVQRKPGNIDPLDVFRAPGNGKLDFAAGHGTFAAGIVRLVDPEARIKIYRALDSDGFASEIDVACAMIHAVKEGRADVLNVSCGMRTVDDAPSVAFQLALDVIEEIAVKRGREVVVVASAGNYGNTRPVWPAAFSFIPAYKDRVVSVAALNARHQRAGWSSRGKWVTCSCVGQGIVSTFVPGEEDPEFSKHHPRWPHPDSYPLAGQLDAWAVWSGTSFAAPQIAGAISRTMRQQGLASPRAAAQVLLAQGVHLSGFGQAMCLLAGT
jgi:subtilisin family serine protease